MKLQLIYIRQKQYKNKINCH